MGQPVMEMGITIEFLRLVCLSKHYDMRKSDLCIGSSNKKESTFKTSNHGFECMFCITLHCLFMKPFMWDYNQMEIVRGQNIFEVSCLLAIWIISQFCKTYNNTIFDWGIAESETFPLFANINGSVPYMVERSEDYNKRMAFWTQLLS